MKESKDNKKKDESGSPLCSVLRIYKSRSSLRGSPSVTVILWLLYGFRIGSDRELQPIVLRISELEEVGVGSWRTPPTCYLQAEKTPHARCLQWGRTPHTPCRLLRASWRLYAIISIKRFGATAHLPSPTFARVAGKS